MTSLNLNLSKPTCRVCLQNNYNEMSSIFDLDTGYEDDLLIFEKIEKCADIKIIHNDKIPTLICGKCHDLLNISYKFRETCRDSDDLLKKFFSNEDSPTLQKTSANKNPLLIVKKTAAKRGTRTQYKKRRNENTLEPSEIIKNKQGIKTLEKNEAPENLNDRNFDDAFDTDHQDDDPDLLLKSDIDIKEEGITESKIDKTPIKRKRSTTKAKNTKTIAIASDGTGVIREKKSRARRVKKEKQPHICDVCGNIFKQRYALETHMRRHRDEKQFKCEICGYECHCSFELIRHMRTHTGSRPYKCSYCYRAFGDQSTLIKHERVHRNERPYECETCGKTFSYSGVLKYHMYTHTGEKPFSCELCGKAFTHLHHLRAHLETLQHINDPKTKILLEKAKKK